MNELEELLLLLRNDGWHTTQLTDLSLDSGQPWWSWHLTKRCGPRALTSVSATGGTLLDAVYAAADKARAWDVSGAGAL